MSSFLRSALLTAFVAAGASPTLAQDASVDTLVRALTDQHDVIRSDAESALASADVDDIKRSLVPLLRTSKSPAQRAAVVSVLKSAIVTHYKAEDDSSLELLDPIIGRGRDVSPRVRRAVAEAVGELALREREQVRFPPYYDVARAWPTILRLLADSSASVRLAAVDAIAAMRDKTMIPVLRQHLSDADARVRQRIRTVIPLIDPDLAAPAGLKSRDDAARLRTINDVKPENLKAVRSLIELLAHDSNAAVRAAAAERLGAMEYREHPAMPDTDVRDLGQGTALAAALRDSDTGVAIKAAEALQRVGSTEGMTGLIDALADPRPALVVAAARALFDVTYGRAFNNDALSDEQHDTATQALLGLLKSDDADVRQAASQAVPPMVRHNYGPRVLAAYEATTDDARVKNDLLEAMAYILHFDKGWKSHDFEDDARRVAIRTIDDPALVVGATRLLYEFESPPAEVADRLIAIISSGSHGLSVYESMKVLERLKERRAVPALIALMKAGGDPNDPKNAAIVLGNLGDTRAIDPLLDALRSTNDDLRGAAAGALGEFSDPRIVPALERALLNASVSTRSAAVVALGRTHDPAAFATLSAFARRRDSISGNAIAALAELGDPRGIVVLRELLREAVESRSTWLESAARSALKKLGADR